MTRLLRDRGIADEVPAERMDDVVNWVGGNPRALQVLAACLVMDPLEVLLELEPAAWEFRNREVDAALIQRLESRFLQRLIRRLSDQARALLVSLAVYRRARHARGIFDPFDHAQRGPRSGAPRARGCTRAGASSRKLLAESGRAAARATQPRDRRRHAGKSASWRRRVLLPPLPGKAS